MTAQKRISFVLENMPEEDESQTITIKGEATPNKNTTTTSSPRVTTTKNPYTRTTTTTTTRRPKSNTTTTTTTTIRPKRPKRTTKQQQLPQPRTMPIKEKYFKEEVYQEDPNEKFNQDIEVELQKIQSIDIDRTITFYSWSRR